MSQEPNYFAGCGLVPGCGSGHDVRLLARQPGCIPHGLDIAPLALQTARTYPQAGSEVYHLADFLDLPAGFHGAYDWLFEHTCLCALLPCHRETYARSAWQALKPGGKLIGIFYLSVANADSDKPPYEISRLEIDALFDGLFRTVRSWVPEQCFPGRELREEMRILIRIG